MTNNPKGSADTGRFMRPLADATGASARLATHAWRVSVVFILPGVLLRPSFPRRTTYFVGAHTLENVRAPLRIGGNTTYGEYLHGVIDEVRIYNRAQPPDEIRRDMSTSAWATPPRADLVAAYEFDEGAGTMVHDMSGRGSPGTISGVIWTDQGKLGRALIFDGLRSPVSTPSSPGLDLSAGMTLSVWIYPMSGSQGRG